MWGLYLRHLRCPHRALPYRVARCFCGSARGLCKAAPAAPPLPLCSSFPSLPRDVHYAPPWLALNATGYIGRGWNKERAGGWRVAMAVEERDRRARLSGCSATCAPRAAKLRRHESRTRATPSEWLSWRRSSVTLPSLSLSPLYRAALVLRHFRFLSPLNTHTHTHTASTIITIDAGHTHDFTHTHTHTRSKQYLQSRQENA